MNTLLLSIISQSLTFLPLALGISISYYILRATDMTLDGSFVIGAAVFAKLIMLGLSPMLATVFALLAGAACGVMTALMQRHGRVDPLLAGVLATFILSSVSILIMNKPNISLLSQTTLVSFAFDRSEASGWLLVGTLSLAVCSLVIFLLKTSFGLALRAFGNNANLFHRQGYPCERYRMMGFGLTNLLSAASGCLTAQTVGYADVNMGLGMTLTGIGAVILGQQFFATFKKHHLMRIGGEFIACTLGVMLYFSALNLLLRFDVNPLYLKMILGLMLIFFLRSATRKNNLEY